MKKPFRVWAGAAIGLAIVALSSCVYDPGYSSGSVSYSSGVGYGDGYGYGGSGFSTSIFVSTGDPRWGYDPYTYSYYDYTRRAYYDPYLYGYYPIGYRPYRVHGVPHPHGWNPGRGYCPPPSRIRSNTLSGYRNRENLYRNSSYSWARNAREERGGNSRGGPSSFSSPQNRGNDNNGRINSGNASPGFRPQTGRDSSDRFQNRGTENRPQIQNSGSRVSSGQSTDISRENRRNFQQPTQSQGSRPQRRPDSPSGFNNPVGTREVQRTAPQRSASPQFQRPSRSEAAPSAPAARTESAPQINSRNGRESRGEGGQFRGRRD